MDENIVMNENEETVVPETESDGSAAGIALIAGAAVAGTLLVQQAWKRGIKPAAKFIGSKLPFKKKPKEEAVAESDETKVQEENAK